MAASSEHLLIYLKCSRSLDHLTRDHSLWVSVLVRLQQCCPLPPEVATQQQMENLSAGELEQYATDIHCVQQLWPQPRRRGSMHTPAHPSPAHAPSLVGIQLVQERWLLSVYNEGIVSIYDLSLMDDASTANPWVFDMGSGGWGSFIARIDNSGRDIHLAVTKTLPPFSLDLYQFSIDKATRCTEAKDASPFQMIKSVSLDQPKLVRDIHPALKLAALSATTTVELWRWTEDPEHKCTRLPQTPDDPQDLWNGIIAARFIGPFLLVSRTRSLEVHHYTHDEFRPVFPPARHYLAYRTFREVSYSDFRVISSGSDEFQQTYEVTMLASDVIQGLFQFLIKIRVPATHPGIHDPGPLHVEVDLIGLYPLSLLIAPHTTNAHAPGSDTPTPLTMQGQFFGRKGEVSRGFLSTFCLGAQAKRAIWVERARSSISREVQVWDIAMQPQAATTEAQEQWHGHFGEGCREIEKNVVYTLDSYDLRDDITHCTFSETTGIIVLGTRSGKIHILPLF